MPPNIHLDHLILFLPLSPTSPEPQIPSSLSKAFTLTPGGTHADNLTTNTLILLSDGCYIELISFIPSTSIPSIQSHWWGPSTKRRGWTDWCLTTSSSAEKNFEIVKGAGYTEPRKGARLRPDGVQVKWAVTFPEGQNGGQNTRGKVPFFCHDEPSDKRGLRVPITEERVRHECGALGVLELTVIVKNQELLVDATNVYVRVFGSEGMKLDDEVHFEGGRVNELEGFDLPTIILRIAKGHEVEKVKNRDFWYGDVVLAARAGEQRTVGDRVRIDGREENEDVGGLWIKYI